MKGVDEVLEVIAKVLIRCVVMIAIVLVFWWGSLAVMGDLAYRAHTVFMPVSRAEFNAIHYAGLVMTKAAMGVFFLIPYVAIRLVLRQRSR